MKANRAQERIIKDTQGQMLVIACPGSGKTTTLLRRIHYMVERQKVPENTVLMITFTRAAAREMRQRYGAMYGANHAVTFSTIHALCLATLRKFAGYSEKNLVSNPADYLFPAIRGNKTIRDKGRFMREALLDISVVKNSQMCPEEYRPACCDDPKLFCHIYRYYTEHMEADGLIDYDDMLLLTYDLLTHDQSVLSWLRERYRYILVDEYQDTNVLQRDIIVLLAGEDGNLAVVGDDDQSIYAFRGARPEIMLEFQKDYPQAKQVCMTTNYRSDREIIRTADRLIRNNSNRFPKKFLASSRAAGSVQYRSSGTRSEEIRELVREIGTMTREQGTDPDQTAVLYRTNAQAMELAEQLNAAGIDFHSSQTIESRYRHWIFQDLCSYWNMAHGTGTRQDYLRTVTHPQRWLNRLDPEKTGLSQREMYCALCDPTQEEWKNEYTMDRIDHYLALLKRLERAGLAEAIREIGSFGGYEQYLSDYAGFRNENPADLREIFRSYQRDIQSWNVRDFPDWLEKIRAYEQAFYARQKSGKGVCISTMHRAKGLEWDTVYLIDAVDGTNPFRSSRFAQSVNLEEERRLFYVAMTRARHRLVISSYQWAEERETTVSPFLLECGLVRSQGRQQRPVPESIISEV